MAEPEPGSSGGFPRFDRFDPRIAAPGSVPPEWRATRQSRDARPRRLGRVATPTVAGAMAPGDAVEGPVRVQPCGAKTSPYSWKIPREPPWVGIKGPFFLSETANFAKKFG